MERTKVQNAEDVLDVVATLDDIAAEVVELASRASTADAVRHAGTIQRGLGALRDGLVRGAWSSARSRCEAEAHRSITVQLENDVRELAGRLAIIVLGFEPGDVIVHDTTRETHGAHFVRVLTRDEETLAVRFDRSWTPTIIDGRVLCLLCDGAGHIDCETCGGTGGEEGQRCLSCRGRGITACMCARRTKVVA